MTKGRLGSKRAALRDAMRGLVGPHQRLVLKSLLQHLEFLEVETGRLDKEAAKRMRREEEGLKRLDDVPGVGRRVAERLLAEIGTDMSRFPTAAHLASWARICPGNNESAGKRKSGATGGGNPWLRSVLVVAAWTTVRVQSSYLSAQYRRLATRRGGKRAIVAVAHTMLRTIYYLLRDGTSYTDLGRNYFDERDRDRVVKRAVHRIEELGYKVTVQAG